MARFPLTLNSENEQLRRIYDEISYYGFGSSEPLNWFKAQAIRPDILVGTWSLIKAVLAEGLLPATLKQLIAVTVSKQADCRYCAALHTRALESLGVPKDTIERCATEPELTDLPPTYREVLRVVIKAARDARSVTDDDIEHLKQQGLTAEEIIEVMMSVGLVKLINTWAELSHIPLDAV